jgi:hypothetical protein
MDGIYAQLLWVALIPLVGFLVLKEWEREKHRSAQRAARLRAVSFEGQPLDLAPLQERVTAVKANYTAAHHDRPADASARRSLVSRAREKLSRLGFFQHQPHPAESEQQTH